jgi:hypothetical protein
MTRLIALNLHGCLEHAQQPDCRPTRDRVEHREGSSQPANGADARAIFTRPCEDDREARGPVRKNLLNESTTRIPHSARQEIPTPNRSLLHLQLPLNY